MGLYDTVKGLMSKWTAKRKRGTNDDDAKNEPEAKKVCAYSLTPAKKFWPTEVLDQRNQATCYTMGELVKTTETRNFEFKTGGVFFKEQALKELVEKYGPGFLNSEGGIILGGVTDGGVVQGVQFPNQRSREVIWKTVYDTFADFRPTVNGKQLWQIDFIPVFYRGSFSNNLFVIEFSIKKGLDAEIYENGQHKVFLRRDGGVQGPLRPLDIKNLVIAKYNEQIDERKKKERCDNAEAKKVAPVALKRTGPVALKRTLPSISE